MARRAAEAGLDVIALTDHDTLAGVPEATAAGDRLGLRVIPGCEFSVAGPGGEMHLLAYFLPCGDPAVERFLADQRAHRATRAREIVRRLQHSGVSISEGDVRRAAGPGDALGRPHVARAMMAKGVVGQLQEAFDRFLGQGRPAYVPKTLPSVETVAALARSVGGVTSAAHLKDRGVRPVLEQLRKAGVDGAEVLHPSHDPATVKRITRLATELGLLPTGGTDWHGSAVGDRPLLPLGGLQVPHHWLDALERLHAARVPEEAKR